MKKSIFIFGSVVFLAATMQSCTKNKCHECHYDDASGNEVEIGEKCGDELETLEANGYTDSTGNYVVHCHGH
jgi:hypothetical protein